MRTVHGNLLNWPPPLNTRKWIHYIPWRCRVFFVRCVKRILYCSILRIRRENKPCLSKLQLKSKIGILNGLNWVQVYSYWIVWHTLDYRWWSKLQIKDYIFKVRTWITCTIRKPQGGNVIRLYFGLVLSGKYFIEKETDRVTSNAAKMVWNELFHQAL